jgi:uncharacterized protein (DUF427 family)
MVKAIWSGKIIAESDRTEIVEGNHYFPVEAVNKEYLKESDHHTMCLWKGTASYYDVVVEGEVNQNAAWYYPAPKKAAEHITGRVAFWKGVRVEE